MIFATCKLRWRLIKTVYTCILLPPPLHTVALRSVQPGIITLRDLSIPLLHVANRPEQRCVVDTAPVPCLSAAWTFSALQLPVLSIIHIARVKPWQAMSFGQPHDQQHKIALQHFSGRTGAASIKVGLADGGPQPVPLLARWVNLPRSLDDEGDGQVTEVRVDQAGHSAGEARKRSVHSVVRKNLAVDAIVGGGGNGANDVACRGERGGRGKGGGGDA